MKKQVEADREKKSVQVTGATVEEALNQASIELGLPVRKLEYEVLERGNRGILGFGKKEWILIAYEAVGKEKVPEFSEDVELDLGFGSGIEEQDKDRNGEAFIRLFPEGAYLKVTPPSGSGKPVNERTVIEKLRERGVHDFDNSLVRKVIKQAEGEYIKIGEFIYNPVSDPVMAVDIKDFEMQAYLVVKPPGPGGTDLSRDAIIAFLKSNNVVHGIKEDVVQSLEDHPVYNQPVLVAEGTKPVNGNDAKIIYNFETDRSRVRLKEKDGRVDFKELNLLQNVVEGQVLAKKIPAEEGQDGRTVTGRVLPAKPGRDVEIGVGKNVRLSEDGMTLTATCNGQVMLAAGKVNVEPIYVVQGDVNMKVGNITHLGTVIVKGNVEDGFKVKASGNIEIMGTVGKTELDAEGDIVVHQGITGKSEGKVIAGKSVWAKFIENASVEAGENVVVSDGIINSRVDANKSIICHSQGRRAKIVGGHLRAAEEIIAETFGSTAGAETVLEVGYDPKSKARLAELEQQKAALDKELDEVNLNIQTLAKLKKEKKELPEEKKKYIKELVKRRSEIDSTIEEIVEEMSQIQSYLASLKYKGKISASKRVFPGVKIYIKDANLNVRNEFKAVSFINEGNIVKVTKYEEPAEDYFRRK